MDGNNSINANSTNINSYRQNLNERDINTEKDSEINTIFGGLDDIGGGEYNSDGEIRAEFALSNDILSEKAVTLSEKQQKELLEESGIDINNYQSIKADDGTVSFMLQEGNFIRVVNDNDEVKIIHTTINGDKASTEVYKNDKPKSDYSKFQSDENGNLNETQKNALAKDITDGKLKVFLNKDENGHYFKNPIMSNLNQETYEAVWQEVASITAETKLENKNTEQNKSSVENLNEDKYAKYKPDEDGCYTEEQISAFIAGYIGGSPEFDPHNPEAVYFNVGDAELLNKVKEAVDKLNTDTEGTLLNNKSASNDDKYSAFKPDENGNYTPEQMKALVDGYLQGTPEFNPHNPDAVFFNVGDAKLYEKVRDAVQQEDNSHKQTNLNSESDNKYSEFKADKDGNYSQEQLNSLIAGYLNGTPEFNPHNPDAVYFNVGDPQLLHKVESMIEQLNSQTDGALRAEDFENKTTASNDDKYSAFKPDENGNYTPEQMKALVDGYLQGTPEFNPHNPDAVFFNVGDAKLYEKVRDAVQQEDNSHKQTNLNSESDNKYSEFKADKDGNYSQEQLNSLIAGYLNGTPEFNPHNPDAVYFNVGDPQLLHKVESMIEQLNSQTDGALRAEDFEQQNKTTASNDDKYSEYRPDENGNYTPEQMKALADGYEQGTPEFNPHNPDAVYFNVDDPDLLNKVRNNVQAEGHNREEEVIPETETETVPQTETEIQTEEASAEETIVQEDIQTTPNDGKYSQFKPDENGNYTEEQAQAIIEGYMQGTPEFDPHNPDAVYFNVGDPDLLNKVQDTIEQINNENPAPAHAGETVNEEVKEKEEE